MVQPSRMTDALMAIGRHGAGVAMAAAVAAVFVIELHALWRRP